MQVISKVEELNTIIKKYKNNGKKVGLVPTMGALHNGHRSLIDIARKECDIVVVSVFVNPTQFGENEDFDKYPRDLEKDKELCQKAGCDIIFHPEPEEMYPDFIKGAPLKENLKVKELSYYDRLKVCLARFALRNVDVFVIDDIFKKLDEKETKKIIDYINDLIEFNSATSVIATDNEEIMNKLGGRVVIIENGSLKN